MKLAAAIRCDQINSRSAAWEFLNHMFFFKGESHIYDDEGSVSEKTACFRGNRKEAIMNIQIFGTKKSNDSKKAERYFKERRIKYQFVDMKEKGLSRGEFQSVCKAVGGYENLIDQNCRDKDLLALVTYLVEEARADKIFENQELIRLPIVRNGKNATVGYQPDIWKNWE